MKKISEKEYSVILKLIENRIIPEEGIFVITDEIIKEYVNSYSQLYGKGKIGKPSNLAYAKKLAGLTITKLFKLRYNENTITNKNIRSSIVSGFIYILQNNAFPGLIKIGYTHNLEARLRSYLTGDPYNTCKFIFTRFSENAVNVERTILNEFEKYIINGEWVRVDEINIDDIINRIKELLGCEPNGKAPDC